MWISRKVYDDLKKEHQRTVEALTAWIEHLTAQIGAPGTPVAPAPPPPSPDMAMFVGDDEQDLRDAHEMGLIDEAALEEGLRQIGFLNAEIRAS